MDGKRRPEQQFLKETQPWPWPQPRCSPLTAVSLSLSPSGKTVPLPAPGTCPGLTYVLASFPPYMRWASFSSSMSQYLLQNSVTSFPWSFTAFMGG